MHYRLEGMKKAGIPVPQYPKAPVYKVPTVTKKNQDHTTRDTVTEAQRVRTQSRQRNREREHRTPSKIRRGTWGGDRRSAAFKGRAKRRGIGREGVSSPPHEDGDSRDWFDEVSSPAPYDGNGSLGESRESGARSRGTGRRKSSGRGGGSIGGNSSREGSYARDVSVTRERDVSIGRNILPALAIVTNDDTAIDPQLRKMQISPPIRQASISSNRSNNVDLPTKEPLRTTPHSTDNNTNTTSANVIIPYKPTWGGRRIKGVSMKKQAMLQQQQQQQIQRQGSPELYIN